MRVEREEEKENGSLILWYWIYPTSVFIDIPI